MSTAAKDDARVAVAIAPSTAMLKWAAIPGTSVLELNAGASGA